MFSAQVLAAAKTAFIAKFVVTTGEVGYCVVTRARTHARTLTHTYTHTHTYTYRSMA